MAITLLGVLYALFLIKRVLYSFLLTETMATYVGIGILGGVFWRRANRWGAVSSLVAAMAANFTLYHARGERLDHWDPGVFLIALLTGVAVLVAVSLLTPPEPAANLESFYKRLDTPTAGPAETAAKDGRQLILVHLLHLRRGAGGVGTSARLPHRPQGICDRLAHRSGTALGRLAAVSSAVALRRQADAVQQILEVRVRVQEVEFGGSLQISHLAITLLKDQPLQPFQRFRLVFQARVLKSDPDSINVCALSSIALP